MKICSKKEGKIFKVALNRIVNISIEANPTKTFFQQMIHIYSRAMQQRILNTIAYNSRNMDQGWGQLCKLFTDTKANIRTITTLMKRFIFSFVCPNTSVYDWYFTWKKYIFQCWILVLRKHEQDKICYWKLRRSLLISKKQFRWKIY